MKNLKISTALAAVTLAAASLATPLTAQANNFGNNCADESTTVLGAIAGGVAGAAIGDGVAGRGQSTEIGILGAVLGGVAGAAIGDSISGCENYDPNRQAYPTTTSYPTTSYPTTNGVYTSQQPVYAPPTTVYSEPRTVYTSPRIVTPTPPPVYTQPQVVTSAPVYTQPRVVTPAPVYTQSPVYSTNTSYGSNRGFDQTQNRLFQLDHEIDRLCDEIDYLKAQRRRARGRSSGLKSRIKQLEYRVDDLKRERKQIRKYGLNSRNSFRSY